MAVATAATMSPNDLQDIEHPRASSASPSPTTKPELSLEAAYFASRPPPASLKALGVFLNKKRRAAAQAATLRGATTSYIDQDDSGTYDPNFKPRKFAKIKTHFAKKLKDESNDADEQKFRKPKGYGHIVKFKFSTEFSRTYLRTLPPGPEGLPIFLSEADEGEEESDADRHDSQSRKRRKLNRKTKLPIRYTENSRLDGLTLESILSEDPLGRSCKSCFLSTYGDCSLITSAFEYPCQACSDANVECELIVPPILKRVCEPCKRKKIICSYRKDGGKGQTSCENCSDDAEPCVAAPLDPESTYAKRFSLTPEERENDNDVVEIDGERTHRACNQCRNGSKRCSLTSKNDKGPCTNCRRVNDKCRFTIPIFRERAFEQTQVAVGNPQWEQTGVDENIPQKSMRKWVHELKIIPKPKRFIAQNEVISITTSFIHPISFNYDPAQQPQSPKPCNFCTNPFFGLTGNDGDYGPRKIEGYYLPHGRGFHEVHLNEDGEDVSAMNVPEGVEPTRMCVECTSTRVDIYCCKSHLLEPIDGSNIPNQEAFTRAAALLAAGDTSPNNLILQSHFCSVCPAFARLRCTESCGLYLCYSCGDFITALQNSGTWKGNTTLDALVEHVRTSPLKTLVGMRSDATFLTKNGELLVRLRAGMGNERKDEKERLERLGKKKAIREGLERDQSFRQNMLNKASARLYPAEKSSTQKRDDEYQANVMEVRARETKADKQRQQRREAKLTQSKKQQDEAKTVERERKRQWRSQPQPKPNPVNPNRNAGNWITGMQVPTAEENDERRRIHGWGSLPTLIPVASNSSRAVQSAASSGRGNSQTRVTQASPSGRASSQTRGTQPAPSVRGNHVAMGMASNLDPRGGGSSQTRGDPSNRRKHTGMGPASNLTASGRGISSSGRGNLVGVGMTSSPAPRGRGSGRSRPMNADEIENARKVDELAARGIRNGPSVLGGLVGMGNGAQQMMNNLLGRGTTSRLIDGTSGRATNSFADSLNPFTDMQGRRRAARDVTNLPSEDEAEEEEEQEDA